MLNSISLNVSKHNYGYLINLVRLGSHVKKLRYWYILHIAVMKSNNITETHETKSTYDIFTT